MIVDMTRINGIPISSLAAPGCAPVPNNYIIANGPPYTLILSSELEQLRTELAQSKQQQAEYINKLEHTLLSFVDFLEHPTIAGDSYAAIRWYSSALCKKVRSLLELDDEAEDKQDDEPNVLRDLSRGEAE